MWEPVKGRDGHLESQNEQPCSVRYVKIVRKKKFHEAIAVGAFCLSKMKRTSSTAVIDPGYFPHSTWQRK